MADNTGIQEEEKKSRKEKRNEKRFRRKQRPLWVRILIQFNKSLFIRLPATIVILLILSLIFIKLYLSPGVVENLARTQFQVLSTGSLDLNVRAFSPYSGFVIENLIIRSGDDFGQKTFIEIKRLVLRYSLGGIFLGHINFPEIGIYEPKIYLREKGGVWNAATLMRPSEKKDESPIDKVETKEGKNEISLPLAVDIFVNFVIKDFDLIVESGRFDAGLKGLSFNFKLDIPPFKKIPLSVAAVSLLKEMKVELNPREHLIVHYRSKEAEVGPPLILTWKLDFRKNGTGKPGFSNIFKMGTYKTPVRFVNHHLTPLHFLVAYDLFYDPSRDSMNIRDFLFSFKNSYWIRLVGNIEELTKDPDIDITMGESSILLDDLYPYFRTLTGDTKTRFSGKISLQPLEIKGKVKDINIRGAIRCAALSFRKESMSVSLPNLSLEYTMSRRGENADITTAIHIPSMIYNLAGGRNGNLGFDLQSSIEGRGNFTRIIIPSMILRLFNPQTRANALFASINGDVFSGGGTSGWLQISRLSFDKEPLAGMVPGSLKAKIASIPLKKTVESKLYLKFGVNPRQTEAEANITVDIPDYNLPDLFLHASVLQDNKTKRLSIRSLDLGSRSRNFSLGVQGYLVQDKAPFSDADIKVRFSLDNPELKNLYGPWDSSGRVAFETQLKGDLETGSVRGAFSMDSFVIKNRENYFALNNANMVFPFVFDFKASGKGQSLLGMRQSQIIDNKRFSDKANFRIDSIWAKHPARNISFQYMKDFSAFMEFRDNVFRLMEMKAYIIDGSMYARRIMVNLGNLDMAHLDFKSIKDNIEYSLNLDLTNVDIGRLDEAEGKKKSRDAELSLNANFAGRGVDMSRELNAEGYINIFKVGEKFANKLMKGLSKEKGKSKLGIAQPIVDNSVSVKGFQFNLDKGLVYTTVTFKGGFLSKLASIENNRIEFDRIPIQEYLRKVQKED